MKNLHTRTVFSVFLSVSLLLVLSPAASAQLSEAVASRQTLFNSITDTIATIGKTPKEKQKIRRERRALRRAVRKANYEARQNKKTQQKIKRQEKIIMEKIEAKKGQ